MKKIDFLICFCLFLTASFPVDAYELATHGHLARVAFKRSVLADRFLSMFNCTGICTDGCATLLYDEHL